MSKELFEAVETHDVDLLARLLMEGADPNALNGGWPEWLPLQAAVEELAEGGPVEALTLLLRHGARVDEMGPDRTATALPMAILRRQPEAVRMLLAVGADPNYQGSETRRHLIWTGRSRGSVCLPAPALWRRSDH
jgi:hypothetical protein